MPIRVFIADDHKLFRLGLINILQQFDGVQVAGEAENGLVLLQSINGITTDLVLLDINMPEMDGLTALPLLLKEHPRLKVIMLSMHTGDNYVQQCIELGACGYLSKNADPDEIEEAIHSVHENGFYFNQNTGKQMLQNMVRKRKLVPRFDGTEASFSEVELEVIRCVCQEKSNTEIAEQLNMSKRTIEDVRSRVLKKANVKSTIGIVLFAARQGLV
ncbi:MAG: response regulator transcription factor [Bacteroidetes bacterium]|nr:response regulator transcription factor [Bacteroidota bacterium]